MIELDDYKAYVFNTFIGFIIKYCFLLSNMLALSYETI